MQRILLCWVMWMIGMGFARGADQAQWGQAWSRNMISEESPLPTTFDPESGQGIRWSVELGTSSHASPVIADGRVYMGTNNDHPRDERHQGDRGVLMCFSEVEGAFLWQLVVPKMDLDDPYKDWPKAGLCSPPTVHKNRVYVVTNRGEVLCLDPQGMANGNDGPFLDEGAFMTAQGAPEMAPGPLDADILWRFDMVRDAGIYPHDSAHSSPLILGRYLYLNTGTGVDNTHKKIRTPEAPSLLVLDALTGTLVARDREGIAPRVFHATWSSPSLMEEDGKQCILLAAGDGVVYGFRPLADTPGSDPATLVVDWKYDLDPKAPKSEVHRFNSNKLESPSNVYGMPVVVDHTVFVAGGGDLWWGKNEAFLHAVKSEGVGDVTDSNLRWKFPLDKHVMSTPAVADGLVYVADTGGQVYCLEQSTGKMLWQHSLRGPIWASPYVADDKVYLGTRRGAFLVFRHGPEKEVLAELDLKRPISATAVAANQTLYVATMERLYALRSDVPDLTPPRKTAP